MKEHQQILIYIQEKMDQLTKHEQIIAKYIIENPEEIINLSAKSLGEVTHSSAASVIRCVHKLDFKGFTDLKLALSRYLPSHHHKIYEEITEDETYETIANKLFSRAEHTLIETKHQINYDNLEQIIQQLKIANTIIVFGMGASNLVAEDVYQKFTRIGKHVIQSSDTHFLATAIASQKNNCVFMGISNTGENQEVLSLVKVAHKYNREVIGLSQSKGTRLARLSDYYMVHDASTEQSLRLAATSSLIAQLMIVDILFYSYISKEYNQHLETISTTKDAVELYLNQ